MTCINRSPISEILRIGKTRFGRELYDYVRKNLTQSCLDLYNNQSDDIKKLITYRRWTNIHFEYLYMDFGNGYSLDDYDYDLDATVIIGLRIAYSFFIEKKYDLGFREFRFNIERLGDNIIKLFNVDTVIRY